MTRDQAQKLLDIVYNNESTPEEKELAYRRLSLLFEQLLPKE